MTPFELIVAQVSAALFAATNLIDTHLLTRFNEALEKVQKRLGRDAPVQALLILSTIASLAAIPFFVLAPPLFGETFAFWPDNGWTVVPYYIALGVLGALLIWAYLKALFSDGSPGAVVIFYQLVPVLSYFLSWLVLGEVASQSEKFALLVILFGTSLMAFRLDTADSKLRFRCKTAGYMLIAASCWAAGSVLFKFAARQGNSELENNLWQTLAWEHLILFLIGMGLLAFHRTFRRSFVEAFKVTTKMDKGWNVVNEVLYMLGVTLMHFVTLNVLVVVSMMVQTFQSFYVWVGTIILVAFGVKSAKLGTVSSNIQMLLAIAISGLGVWLLWLAESGHGFDVWLDWFWGTLE